MSASPVPTQLELSGMFPHYEGYACADIYITPEIRETEETEAVDKMFKYFQSNGLTHLEVIKKYVGDRNNWGTNLPLVDRAVVKWKKELDDNKRIKPVKGTYTKLP